MRNWREMGMQRQGQAISKGSGMTLRQRIASLFRLLLAVATLIILSPFVLILVYAAPETRPVSTLMLARHATLQPVDRQWVPIGEIAPVLQRSVLMSEDGRFCSHRGVDWRELNAVIDDALEGERTRGASTLPMQTVKNLFLWHGRSFLRKAIEIPLALFADLVWPKRRMMEIYLNIAEWDPGVFGAEAASRHYFGRPAKDLTARQAALLTVTLPNPASRNPARPSNQLQRLARLIEGRANRSGGYIDCLAER